MNDKMMERSIAIAGRRRITLDNATAVNLVLATRRLLKYCQKQTEQFNFELLGITLACRTIF